MRTRFTNLEISGVILVEPQIFGDERGYFMESYNQAEFQAHGITANFVQDNQSSSCYGVIRGLHCQKPPFAQDKLIRVLWGQILDVVVDARLDSPTYGQHLTAKLSSDNQHQLFIPKGCLHGFAVLSEHAVIAYKCDQFYHPEAELTVRYDDPALNIAWPIPDSKRILSTKDRNATLTLEELNLSSD
ncbi:MAG TPA: dTDP-4-dehydrorhamnose 3,5-epimerase [Candidatus Anaerobiospirillum pullistercoris]|uniref:dTDP-4-dehydrorhamnose 3,5-epimerase n=1 Tax=Candidatus Anaerobiospirillum pullistercoris TaxID=2838452 RepID=A0A9D2B005_9GAMM|nr:dTDP-4-dehydrorhamnose 3,5-epimerase [Candidatus Anaerobiospirillum pullistercoris]